MVNTDDRLWEVIMSYIDLIKEKARQDKKTIVLPETNDKRTLIAASRIIEEGIANIIMVGREDYGWCRLVGSRFNRLSGCGS